MTDYLFPGVAVVFTALCMLFAAAFPYLYYLLGIRFGKKSGKIPALSSFPGISIVISAYNESAVIRRRIENLAESDYPRDRYEVLFIDDCSSDGTGEIARKAFVKCGIEYTFFRNSERKGTNRSYNLAIQKSKYDIIVTTDANKFFRKDTLKILISRLLSDESIAAVCAEVLPAKDMSSGNLVGMEGIYRNFYGRMCDWESSVDSTYNFNGALVAFKKNIISSINERKGADDANTAFEAIRKGYRSVYEINALVFEKVPGVAKKQYKQKIRRAKRLIEATLANTDLLHEKRPFSRRFYPVRIMMYVLCPSLFFAGGILFTAGLLLVNVFLGLVFTAAVLLSVILFRNNLISAFVLNQFYLLSGLLHLGKDMRVWESTSV
ncbi:cellulose synthase/poly-beta-1,6-N-acetylglucosamine synthase-like glycosyltransferase [Methanomicrobium sp. W14]|uniref:glycosyltransferase n=1 Tax=Methanomicrobium sp. W14 TaxID=2817839 RepID=UPI001AEA4728|nr:glycosyltransferase [Methanomicrobium sp. W14]MBP2133365.1 cellulose synthase/poly-beta-1,6-N-acetylglucosamine synthase-like glycosyltransferase [Methanomicrobium sp. W14]